MISANSAWNGLGTTGERATCPQETRGVKDKKQRANHCLDHPFKGAGIQTPNHHRDKTKKRVLPIKSESNNT